MRKRSMMFASIVLVSGLLLLDVCRAGPVCCVPDQYEADVFLSTMTVTKWDPERVDKGHLIDYDNGSLSIAWDFTNQRSMWNFTGQFSQFTPHPIVDVQNMLTVFDFRKRVQYTTNGKFCRKGRLLPMARMCIPGNATRRATGRIGAEKTSSRDLSLYTYAVPSQFIVMDSLVESSSCSPVEVTYRNTLPPKLAMLDMATLSVSDVTPGIRDPRVFDVPKACLKHDRVQFDREEELEQDDELPPWVERLVEVAGLLFNNVGVGGL